ncbi:MAG: GNAT family N-acetyltransferase [Bacillota bacterium]
MTALAIRPPHTQEDWEWVTALWREEWGGEVMVTRGQLYRLSDLQALVAWDGGDRVGLATYLLHGDSCELMSLNALTGRKGVGTALLAAVEEVARQHHCRRLWLITSNDNLDALRFYQRRGYRLTAVHVGAIDQARALKPTIPLIGHHGIPIRDELELAKEL